VLQFIVLATAWNILGGYAGYVNFGSGAFFAVGLTPLPALFKAFVFHCSPTRAAMVVSGLLGFHGGRSDIAPARHLLLYWHSGGSLSSARRWWSTGAS